MQWMIGSALQRPVLTMRGPRLFPAVEVLSLCPQEDARGQAAFLQESLKVKTKEVH